MCSLLRYTAVLGTLSSGTPSSNATVITFQPGNLDVIASVCEGAVEGGVEV